MPFPPHPRLRINIEGCVNNLNMDCMKFYHRYARDGRNYTARAVYPCYFDETATHFVVIDYDPEKASAEQTLPFFKKKYYFVLWALKLQMI